MTGIDFERLRRKGWSEVEVTHAKGVLQHAEEVKHKHVRLWEFTLLLVLLFLGIVGTVGLLLFVYPVFLFTSLAYAIPIMLIAGAALGLLLTAALRSLHAVPRHHVSGMSLLFILSLAAATIIIGLLQRRFRIAPGIQFHSVLLLAIIMVVGMMAPYLLERRLHGPS